VITLVRREIRDSLRDWRIILPIIVLTVFFPVLMSIVANMALGWVAKYGAAVVGDRLLPFLLMVVGFFPISFSLVIALETFVGEKERRSLEPLLSTPLTDTELYLGKMIAAMAPPLLAAYLGITVYLGGLYFFKGWLPPVALVVLVLVLTTVEAIVMVAGAVVVSTQTTSVRAANLLASFIIIPMALLIQGEAIIMFWANYHVLWWIVLFLLIVAVILVRAGIHTFNREELLGQDIDELNIAGIWRSFKGHFCWDGWFFSVDPVQLPRWLRWVATLGGLYRIEVPDALRRSRLAFVTAIGGILLSVAVGQSLAADFPIPGGIFQLGSVSGETFANVPEVGWLPAFTVWGVLSNNVRSLLFAALMAVFSFGVMAVALLMIPMAVIFFFVVQAAYAGYDPGLFLLAFVLPHGLFELPAAITATALAVRLGAAFMARHRGVSVRGEWLWALADFVKVFVAVVLPLLAIAAIVEIHVTPQVVVWFFGR